jgi:hypothetical protein
MTLTDKQRELLGMTAEGLLLVALLGGASLIWEQKHATNTVTTKTVVVSGKPVAAPANAALHPTPLAVPLSTMEGLSLPIDSLVAGYQMSLQVPAAWRSVDIRDLETSGTYASYNLNDLAALLRMIPEHSERSTGFPMVEPINVLDILGTAGWVTKNDGDNATPANKQAYLNYLGSLKTVADLTKKCTPITTDGSSVCADAKVKAQIIKTADGALTGVAYLYMQTQSASYDPSVVVELVGTVAGKPVHLSGSFAIYDILYMSLGANGVNAGGDQNAKIAAARKAFAEGNPAADTQEAYGRVVAAVQSISFAHR